MLLLLLDTDAYEEETDEALLYIFVEIEKHICPN